MRWMIAMMGATAGGMLAWWLGGFFGFTAAFFASIFGSAIGWYVGARFYHGYLE